jgi:diguanylate cyclase (GGDEF)-like protein
MRIASAPHKLRQTLIRIKDENRRLVRELRQKAKELSFFINTGKALTSTLEFKKVLRIIMDKAQRLIRCDAWSLMLIDEAKDELYFALVKGQKSQQVKDFRLKMGQGVAGWVAKTGKPLMVNSVKQDPRFHPEIDRITRFKTRCVLCVPIVNKRKTVGVLEMINKSSGKAFDNFDSNDLDLLTKLVDQAAIALERSSLYQQMSDLAVTDDLTKLYNFRYLDQALDRDIRRCQRYGSFLSVIFFDMDYFKRVNDNHGHLAGSKVLVEVGQLLLRGLRDVDIIARYGGDEYVVLLPETGVKTAVKICQRLHKALREHPFLGEEGLNLHLTASFGIAGFPDHATSKKDLLRLADQAMYVAKNTGRDRICVAEPTGRAVKAGRTRRVAVG